MRDELFDQDLLTTRHRLALISLGPVCLAPFSRYRALSRHLHPYVIAMNPPSTAFLKKKKITTFNFLLLKHVE